MKGLYTILLLIVSNVFMTFAWYGHLKLQDMKVITNWPLYAIILFSWSIALAEYFCLVPANRIGFIGNGMDGVHPKTGDQQVPVWHSAGAATRRKKTL